MATHPATRSLRARSLAISSGAATLRRPHFARAAATAQSRSLVEDRIGQPNGVSVFTTGNTLRVYISALRAAGYRNLEGTFELCEPLAVLVGENNSGKSNLIDALRTVLEPEAGP